MAAKTSHCAGTDLVYIIVTREVEFSRKDD